MNWQINMNVEKRLAREEGYSEGLSEGRNLQKTEDAKLLAEANAELEKLRKRIAELEKSGLSIK